MTTTLSTPFSLPTTISLPAFAQQLLHPNNAYVASCQQWSLRHDKRASFHSKSQDFNFLFSSPAPEREARLSYQDVAMIPKRDEPFHCWRDTTRALFRWRSCWANAGNRESPCRWARSLSEEKGVERVVVIVSSPLSSGFEMSACHPDTVYSTRAAESLERHAGDVMVGAWWNRPMVSLSLNTKPNIKMYQTTMLCTSTIYLGDRHTLKLRLLSRSNDDKTEIWSLW